MNKKNLVILTGAGMSAESGINTFRGAGGLWEGQDITEVASPEGWNKNPKLVLDFYNKRRNQLISVHPNEGHKGLTQLEDQYNVTIITQNIDDLHERAGSSNVLHLHGELLKVRSTVDEDYILNWPKDLNIGDKDPNGNQMRPHIVWFGEAVPMLERAVEICHTADILVVIGTSLLVYPAASLVHFVPDGIKKIIIDPAPPEGLSQSDFRIIQTGASAGVVELLKDLLKN